MELQNGEGAAAHFRSVVVALVLVPDLEVADAAAQLDVSNEMGLTGPLR